MIRLGLRDLPELPDSSALQVEETWEGLQIRWINARFAAGREGVILGLFLLGVRLLVAGVAVWALGRRIAEDLALHRPTDWALLVFLLVFGAVGALSLFHLAVTLGSRKGAVLVLGDAGLDLRPGTPPFTYGSRLRRWMQKEWKEGLKEYFAQRWWAAYVDKEFWRPLWPRRRVKAERAEVTGVLLDRADERERLLLHVGTERTEVASYLGEPDREWLADVLRLWLAQG